MQRTDLSGRGRVVEWTRVHKAAPGYEGFTPYVLALIETAEGPQLMGQVVDLESDAKLNGAHVKAVFRRIGQDGLAGIIHYGVKWRLDPDASTWGEDGAAAEEE